MNEYKDSFSSLLKFCSDFATDAQGKGWNIQVMNFDAGGDPKTWPQQDTIGLSEFDLELNDGTIEISAMLVLSTWNDPNGFRLADQMNMLVNRLLPGCPIKLVNASTSALRGILAVRNGTHVAPPIDLEIRTAQGVMINLLSDQIWRP